MEEPKEARPDPPDARLKVLLAAAALAGLLLAAAGTTPAAIAMESLSARIIVDLPSWLGIPFVVLMGLATLYILVLMVPGARLRERRMVGQAKSMLGLMVFLLLAALWPDFGEHLALNINNLMRSLGELRSSAMSSAGPAPETTPVVQSAVVDGILETLLLALCLIGFGVLAWLYLAILPARGRGAPAPLVPDALQAAIEDSLDDLRNLPDARLAIIRCYDRFERALAGADVRRPPWQTAMEFMHKALGHPGLPRESVRELTHLFERARFSHHPMGPEQRERAWHALVAVKGALDREAGNAATI